MLQIDVNSPRKANLIVPILIKEEVMGTRSRPAHKEKPKVRMKATSIGHYLAEQRELLPLNRTDLKIITMLMELKTMPNLAKQGNTPFSPESHTPFSPESSRRCYQDECSPSPMLNFSRRCILSNHESYDSTAKVYFCTDSSYLYFLETHFLPMLTCKYGCSVAFLLLYFWTEASTYQ